MKRFILKIGFLALIALIMGSSGSLLFAQDGNDPKLNPPVDDPDKNDPNLKPPGGDLDSTSKFCKWLAEQFQIIFGSDKPADQAFGQHCAQCDSCQVDPNAQCDYHPEWGHKCWQEGMQAETYTDCPGVPSIGLFCDESKSNCLCKCCGNGVVNDLAEDPQNPNPEQCDDGNNVNGDGCSADCELECQPFNGVKELTEQCDPSVLVGGGPDVMGCLPGQTCDPATCTCEGVCGDGNVDVPPETCDTMGPIFLVLPPPGAVCRPADCKYCGDTNIDAGAGEKCDDGNLADNDGCDKNCQKEFCGDMIINMDFNTRNVDGCEPPNGLAVIQCPQQAGGALGKCDGNCQCECGNGTVDPGEKCDSALARDGNAIDDGGARLCLTSPGNLVQLTGKCKDCKCEQLALACGNTVWDVNNGEKCDATAGFPDVARQCSQTTPEPCVGEDCACNQKCECTKKCNINGVRDKDTLGNFIEACDPKLNKIEGGVPSNTNCYGTGELFCDDQCQCKTCVDLPTKQGCEMECVVGPGQDVGYYCPVAVAAYNVEMCPDGTFVCYCPDNQCDPCVCGTAAIADPSIVGQSQDTIECPSLRSSPFAVCAGGAKVPCTDPAKPC